MKYTVIPNPLNAMFNERGEILFIMSAADYAATNQRNNLLAGFTFRRVLFTAPDEAALAVEKEKHPDADVFRLPAPCHTFVGCEKLAGVFTIAMTIACTLPDGKKQRAGRFIVVYSNTGKEFDYITHNGQLQSALVAAMEANRISGGFTDPKTRTKREFAAWLKIYHSAIPPMTGRPPHWQKIAREKNGEPPATYRNFRGEPVPVQYEPPVDLVGL